MSEVTILHVDDNETNRYVVTRMLQSAGYQVLQAATGEEGLQLAVEQSPDLVILDVQLPGLSGFEVCHRLKSNPATTSIPVLHLSATFVASRDKAQGLDSGADGYLAQPVEPIELIATVRSLLRVRQAEEAALTLAREWQTTFDSISDGVGLLDSEGNFRRCNPRMVKILGKPLSEISGRPHHLLMREVFEVGKGGCFERSKATRQRENLEIQVAGRWYAKSIDPVLDEQGSFTGAVFTLIDITTAKQAEEIRQRSEAERAQLLAREQEARVQAETANRLKDEFLATLSHELRSPLNAMLGWTRLLNTRKLDEATTARAMETIERTARAQAQLVEDLLDVSRIIGGKMQLNVRPMDLSNVIRATVETLTPALEAKAIQLQLELDATIGSIAGDAARLQQVVWNLLSNAIKFTPSGGQVTIKLKQVNSCIELCISDTGQGILPEFVPFVFDRFRQADSSTTRLYGGLGLGLAIVRHLVELHGGTVHAASQGKNQGATFTVKLPLIPTPCPSQPPVQRSSIDPASFVPLPSLMGLRVLVVDDEADARDFLTTALEQCSAEVIVAASAAEAISALQHTQPNILISDIGMPEEDGFSLIRRVRALSPTQGGTVPAIATTAYARPEDRERAIAAGFQSHLSKPIEPAKLASTIVNLSKRTEGSLLSQAQSGL
ncbi:MAG TPA: response regulator [Thermosynechococcaceae cyanobacterium]